MHHFQYIDGELFAEKVSLNRLADEVGTPFYCYSSQTLKHHYKVMNDALKGIDHLICYSVKANSNLSVLKLLADEGAGMDVVSEGEIRRALRGGCDPQKIVFAGVGKTEGEMRYALSNNILAFNVESFTELDKLNDVALDMGLIARVGIRVNPNIDADTHQKITTGRYEDKFGIAYDLLKLNYEKIKSYNNIKLIGLDIHIGSQLASLEPYRQAFKVIINLLAELRENDFTIEYIDVGGGLGIPYNSEDKSPPSPQSFGSIIRELSEKVDCKIILEPGRMIAGNAGIMVCKVLYLKRSVDKEFAIVDGAINDMMRTTLYEAYHEIFKVNKSGEADSEQNTYDVVGPICESGDYFAKTRMIEKLDQDDLIALMSTGAYGAVLSNNYNSRLLIPEVLVNGEEFAIIRKRQAYDELLGRDEIAPWLK